MGKIKTLDDIGIVAFLVGDDSVTAIPGTGDGQLFAPESVGAVVELL